MITIIKYREQQTIMFRELVRDKHSKLTGPRIVLRSIENECDLSRFVAFVILSRIVSIHLTNRLRGTVIHKASICAFQRIRFDTPISGRESLGTAMNLGMNCIYYALVTIRVFHPVIHPSSHSSIHSFIHSFPQNCIQR